MRNSVNFRTRITENGAPDRKIWALEDFKGKTVFLGGSEGICGIFEWLEALAQKNRGSCEVWEFFGDFGGFWSVWCSLGLACKYFLKADGPTVILPSVQRPQHNLQQG
jgi:hypothetical protein